MQIHSSQSAFKLLKLFPRQPHGRTLSILNLFNSQRVQGQAGVAILVALRRRSFSIYKLLGENGK